MRVFKAWEPVPQHQPDAELVQLEPVNDVWYTILDTTARCRLISVAAMVESTSEYIECRITIDGIVLGSNLLLFTAATWYYIGLYASSADDLIWSSSLAAMYKAFLLEGRSVKVEIRKTTQNGIGTLHGIAKYAKW